MNRRWIYALLLPAVSALGFAMGDGYVKAGEPRTSDCGRSGDDPRPLDPVPPNCWDTDACTDFHLQCRRVGSVWEVQVAAGEYLWKSGTPKNPITCVRVYYPASPCAVGTGTSSNYPSYGCGLAKPIDS